MEKKQILTVVGVGIAGIVIWKLLQKKKVADATVVAQAATAAPAVTPVSDADLQALKTYISSQLQSHIDNLKARQVAATAAKNGNDYTNVIRCKERLLNTVKSDLMSAAELQALSTYFLYIENKYIGTKHRDAIEGEAKIVSSKYQVNCVWADANTAAMATDAIKPPSAPPTSAERVPRRTIFGGFKA